VSIREGKRHFTFFALHGFCIQSVMPSPALKLHRSTTAAVIDSLRSIFGDNNYADKVIERTLKKDHRWGARDRRFIAETTYDIVRWFRLYREIGGVDENDFGGLLKVWCAVHEIDIAPWLGSLPVSYNEFITRRKKAESVRKFRESIPDWLDEMGEGELSTAWERELHALNSPASVVLRVNTLKTSRKELQNILSKSDTETYPVAWAPDALVLKDRRNIFQLDAFHDGLFEVQDAGSQAIAPFLDVEPGMRVIDACAGGGGKSLHLAAVMQNKGKILAMDTIDWKLEELKKRSKRAGAANIETRVIDSMKSVKRLENSADRLLLDVPCSGLGVLRRNPDAKWKLTRAFIAEVKKTQAEILRDYSLMVKPGGKLVYSTCSILPSENEEQVKEFIESHPEFSLESEKHILPSEGFDGFYMALIKRSQTPNP
jgi:16S rRNA (cytosine967-C5)-methyltransferase